jgi:hypothetical protein
MNINSAIQSKESSSINTDESACQHCEGIFEHTAWCVTREPRMAYAYLIVRDASKITVGDSLILHSLGVAWMDSKHDVAFGFQLEATA